LRHVCRTLFGALWVVGWLCVGLGSRPLCADENLEHFERHVRPALIQYCYECHSGESAELQGGLRLDVKAGWQLGGDTGQPVIIPGKPAESLLIQSVRHQDGVSAMPPNHDRLPDAVIQVLETWIKRGAVDPRDGEVIRRDKRADWEAEFQRRRTWWSLQPLRVTGVPSNLDSSWAKTDIDRFILAGLESQGLRPAPDADRGTLIRRLSFALTGLPPDPQLVEQFRNDPSPQAYDQLVETLLDSPHFGERWARHWMDVVHYSDTHGYEWDVPVKNAWQYRDYLIRAFNADLPYQQFVLEQVAGDLMPPRIDPASGLNEAMIGPLMLRLGERRHGDSAAVEGVTQEGIANAIDTLGKAFLGTTLACAQCHDHKLDAVEQRDYYSLAGMLMSSRFSTRAIDAVDPNHAAIEQLRDIKRRLRQDLSQRWLAATELDQLDQPGGLGEKLRAVAALEQADAPFPTSLVEFWKRWQRMPITLEAFHQERQRRRAANQSHLTLLADFTGAGNGGDGRGAGGWQWEGFGLQHGQTRDGELVVSLTGSAALQHLLPAGRFSHVWSSRLGGVLQSPQFDPTQPVTFSMQSMAGQFASQVFVVDRALNPERMSFPSRPQLEWSTLVAGQFDSLEGTVDAAPRRVYFELATKSYNNYFPPRVGYGGVSEAELTNPHSWFGVTRVYQHPAGHPPQEELSRFLPWMEELADEPDGVRRMARLLRRAIERWQADQCTSDEVQLLNEAMQAGWLPNDLPAGSETERLVTEYRSVETQLQPDRTVGSAADWFEGRDDRIGIRGSYTDLGDAVTRAQLRFLQEGDARPVAVPDESAVSAIQVSTSDDRSTSSGRWAWAQRVADARNPLTARVYVNRVWHYLFGAGLVRTTDDFGHLGELPSHPELLDHLAARFIAEGWSTKTLIRRIVSSAVWQQQSLPDPAATAIDPENRLWHHMPLRRLEAEAIRDSLLVVSQRWDPTLFGPPIEPYRTAKDLQKRLLPGPLDGLGRRSIYLEMTLMEPPRFLALFNQPLPKQTVGRRDVTNVPDQALALLNDPLVVELARLWSQRMMSDGATTVEYRVIGMLQSALSRSPTSDEVASLIRLLQRSAELRGSREPLLDNPLAWQDAAHAVFNMKEFIYVR
jgi:hypothetical protein